MYYLFEDILSAYDDLYDATELDMDRVRFLDIISEEEADAMGLDIL